eukprot:8466088-Pyramimonas_sp.AAC.1
MLGDACAETSTGHKVSMTTPEVLRYWRFSGSRVDLRIRRLKWYQSWARNPTGHVQPLCALFGVLRGEHESTVPQLVRGRPSISASPWLRQMEADLWAAAPIMDSCSLDEILEDFTIFADVERSSEFTALDFGRLRAALNAVQIPPPTWEQEGASERNSSRGQVVDCAAPVFTTASSGPDAGGLHAPTDGMGEEGPFRCEVRTDEGELCGACFSTQTSLLKHITQQHHLHNLAHVLTPTNICIGCRQVFKTRITAARHLQAAIRRGRCDKGALGATPRSNETLREPKSLKCP